MGLSIRTWVLIIAGLLGAFTLYSCRGERYSPEQAAELAQQAAALPAPGADSAAVLIFGDSLSAGYNMQQQQAWPALLDARLRPMSLHIVNASVSGETTAGGLARLSDVLKQVKPKVFVLQLGANDGLRGLPAPAMQDNLIKMLQLAKQAGAEDLLLIGIKLPPNFGADYNRAFEQAFVDAASAAQADFLPFLLEPIGYQISQFQSDRLHPTVEAQPRLAEHVWPALEQSIAN